VRSLLEVFLLFGHPVPLCPCSVNSKVKYLFGSPVFTSRLVCKPSYLLVQHELLVGFPQLFVGYLSGHFMATVTSNVVNIFYVQNATHDIGF